MTSQSETSLQSDRILTAVPRTAILVGIDLPSNDWPIAESLDELERLATTAGIASADRIVQKLHTLRSGMLLGSGKVEELSALVQMHTADAVIFDCELRPGPHRSLEAALNVQVLDRTALILIIFGHRARTREGRLQVELAQIDYDLPRLARQWGHLSRQRGGSGGSAQRNEGETQLEVDRRLLRRKKAHVAKEVEEIGKQREQSRGSRKSGGLPVVALVGYTNAGKSTLLNRLSHAGVLAEDTLFATLDPTTRRIHLSGGQEFLLTDTVGFVQRLPATLVSAFRATLEESIDADVLVHVVDASSSVRDRQIRVVEETLEEIGAGGKPVILALNKIDCAEDHGETIVTGLSSIFASERVSARTGEGIDTLLRQIADQLARAFTTVTVQIPYNRGELVSLFHRHGTIEEELCNEQGTRIRGKIPARFYTRFLPLLHS